MPSWLTHTIGDNSVLRWMVAATVSCIVLAALLGITRLATKRLATRVERSPHPYASVVVDLIHSLRKPTMIVVALAAGARTLSLDAAIHTWIARGLILALAVQVGLSLTLGIRLVIDRRRSRPDAQPGERTLGAAAVFVSNLIVWSILGLVVLSNFGVEVTTLVAGLGIGGVAAALAVQNVLGDLFAAFSLYIDRPFDLGDFVVVDAFMGTVEKISWRSTQLRSLGGEMVILSNGDLAGARIRNYKRMSERRVVVELGVEYGTSAAKLACIPDIIRKAIESVEGLRFDRAHFAKFGSSSLDFESVFFVMSADYNQFMDRQQELLLRIYRRFEEEGVAFAFPTQTLHLQRIPSSADTRAKHDARAPEPS